MKTPAYNKLCQTPEKMRKEAAILDLLSGSAIRKVIPKVVALDQQAKPTILTTLRIEGVAPTEDNLSYGLMHRLGILAKAVHKISGYQVFGLLDERLSIEQPTDKFFDFIERQINKWIAWHRAASCNNYVAAYGSWIQRCLGQRQSYLNCCQPLFCHGDFDLKNILVKSGIVTGLLDWEHAGAYCLEWELRKLSRYCHRQPELLSAFFEGYFGQIPGNQLILVQAISFIEAADLLGHLRWCITHNLEEEYNITIFRMNQFFPIEEVN